MTILQVLLKHFDAALSLYVGECLPMKLPICRLTVAVPVAFFIHSPRTLDWTFQRIQAHSSGIQKLLISLLAIFCNVLKCLFFMRIECYYFSSPM